MGILKVNTIQPQSGSLTISGGGSFTLDSVVSASHDGQIYKINGGKVTMKNQLQARLDNAAQYEFKMFNTSIASDSVMFGSFNGNHANTNLSGSIIQCNVTSAGTASIILYNETGTNIASDTVFTASFVIM